ncbi:MAG: oligosaccharide flippase family protein [Bacteroidales bacterium]|nr:oligosaccharide flippase family protein [Bacteroidales bacterium]
MRRILGKSYFNSEFFKNSFILSIGTVVAQVIPLLFYPLLGRLYTPEDFGLLATLTSITVIIAVLSSLKYDACILITETKQDGANVIGLILTISFFLLFIIFVVLELFSNQISVWFNSPNLSKLLFVCPLTAYAIIIFNNYNEWCVRNKYFSSLSWNKIGNSGASTLSKVFFGIIKVSSNGLIIGDLLGRTVIAVRSIYDALRKDSEVFLNITFIRMVQLSIRYKEFPKYTLSGALLNNLGGQLPVLLIGLYANSTELGYFAMTMSVLAAPVSLIGFAVKDTFRQRANEDYIRKGECRNIFINTSRVISILTLIGFVPLVFILPFLFRVFLGEQWIIAGEYSQILSPMIALSFITNTVSGVLIIVEKMRLYFLFQIYYFTISAASLIIGFSAFNSMKMTLVCYAVGMSSVYLLEMYLSYKYSDSKQIK